MRSIRVGVLFEVLLPILKKSKIFIVSNITPRRYFRGKTVVGNDLKIEVYTKEKPIVCSRPAMGLCMLFSLGICLISIPCFLRLFLCFLVAGIYVTKTFLQTY
jgi:hypothetical protein